MNEWNDAKKTYEELEIPAELRERVEAGLRQGKANRRKRKFSRIAGTAAACFVVIVGTLNVSPAVAAAAADVPVLGGLFQILTVRSYDKTEDQTHYRVSVPEVEAEGKVAEMVNGEIQTLVDRHVAEMEEYWEEYREAYLATGGTEEEWAERSLEVIADYEIMSQSDTMVSFVVTLAQCGVTASEERYYYNLDLEHDCPFTLRDYLGEDWVDRCNRSVQAQIDASVDEDGNSLFFAPEDGGFQTVDETTSFYVREDGTVVVVFPEYSIAAGAAGIVEFPIQ